MSTIEKLIPVEVREIWKHEQLDFSNWLAREENLEYLNDITCLKLVDVKKEDHVGSFRCDIVAKDETSNISVIIENQLEATDHEHLGKIITYASGLDAKVIIWIVTKAKEEHRAAIEWLNNNTNSNINFFLIEIHAYKIGNSHPAPKFEVIEKPNNFIKANIIDAELNKTQSERLIFWQQFNEVLIQKGKPFTVKKADTGQYYEVAMGTSEASVVISLINREGNIVVEVYISDDKDLFDKLIAKKDEIENELGFRLDWDRLDGKKAARIKYRIPGLNFDNHNNYNDLMNETIEVAVKLRDVFKQHI